MTNKPTAQGTATPQKVGYGKPPVERQFGKPNGNPRNPGGWKREDTARYKLEQMLKLKRDDLVRISNDDDSPLFEKKLAYLLLQEPDWRIVEGMLNQVYGQPKQRLEVEPVQPKPLIDLTEGKKRG